jgi:hypothetical protein
MTVINIHNTNDMEIYEKLINIFDFNNIYEIIQHNKVSDRGNYQNNYGFSILNICGRDQESGIRTPLQNDGTNTQQAIFVKLSNVLSSLTKIPFNMVHSHPERIGKFARQIHPDNVIEGLTLAYTHIKANQSQQPTQYFDCHVDSYNSQQDHFNYLIIVARITKVELNKFCRISVIGYGRKSIDDYFEREKLYMPFLNKLKKYHKRYQVIKH